MRLTVAMGLLLLGAGCTNFVYVAPEVPEEIEAVLGDPQFSEVAEITHEGNLDNLDGCWGSYRVEDGQTDALFYQFSGEDFRLVMYMNVSTRLGDLAVVGIEEGTFAVTGDDSFTATITQAWGSDPATGELESMPPPDGEFSQSYEATLDGDRMEMFVTDVEAEQYTGTFWRFEECP